MYYFGQEWKIRLSLESKYLYRSPLQQPQPRRPQWSSKWRQRQLRRMRKKAGWLQQRTVVALLSDDALLRDREGLRGEDVLLHWDLKCKKKCVEIQSTKIQSIKIIWHFSYLLIFCFWLLCKNLCHFWNDKFWIFCHIFKKWKKWILSILKKKCGFFWLTVYYVWWSRRWGKCGSTWGSWGCGLVWPRWWSGWSCTWIFQNEVSGGGSSARDSHVFSATARLHHMDDHGVTQWALEM